jgi:hypothetical protein
MRKRLEIRTRLCSGAPSQHEQAGDCTDHCDAAIAANGTCAAVLGCWLACRAPESGPTCHTNIGPGRDRGCGAKRLCGSWFPWGRPYARPACWVGVKSHYQVLTFGTCRTGNRCVRSHPMNSSSRKDIHRRSPCRMFRHWRAWSVTAAAGEGSRKITCC